MAAAVDKKLRKKYFNLCDPRESLSPDDDRNVDVDAVSLEARGRNWVNALANRIELSNGPMCEFFTGLPGSGKSIAVCSPAIPTGPIGAMISCATSS
jgi:hypothetical protein